MIKANLKNKSHNLLINKFDVLVTVEKSFEYFVRKIGRLAENGLNHHFLVGIHFTFINLATFLVVTKYIQK